MSCEKITYDIDGVALVVQIIASVLMFLNSPINEPSGAFMVNVVDFETPKKRNSKLKFGFLLLKLFKVGVIKSQQKPIYLVISNEFFLFQNELK